MKCSADKRASKGDQGRDLGRHQVIEGLRGQEFGFCFDSNGTTMKHSIRGGLIRICFVI